MYEKKGDRWAKLFEAQGYVGRNGIGYNRECVRNAGSGIFLHCSVNHPTSSCVSIPSENMVFLLRHIQPGCVISIGSADAIEKQIQELTK